MIVKILLFIFIIKIIIFISKENITIFLKWKIIKILSFLKVNERNEICKKNIH